MFWFCGLLFSFTQAVIGITARIAAHVDDILNKELIITGYKIKESKYPKSGPKCLTLQVVLDDKKYVLFTGSVVLLEQMEKYQDHLPFIATIQKIDRYYTLT